MAARPWENRLIDSNARDSVTAGDDDDKPAEEGKAKAPDLSKPKGKAPVLASQSNGSRQEKAADHEKSHSDVSGCGSSSGRSADVQPTVSLESSKVEVKVKAPQEVADEASSGPSNPASRSASNPKERPARTDAPARKRLSLPNNGNSSGLPVYISAIPPFSESCMHLNSERWCALHSNLSATYLCFDMLSLHLSKTSAVGAWKKQLILVTCGAATAASRGVGKRPTNSSRSRTSLASRPKNGRGASSPGLE